MSGELLIRELLENHTFADQLAPEHINTLAALAESRSYKVGEYLTRTGKPATHCHLICHGQVSVELYEPGRGPCAVETLSSADSVLGWSWLVEPYTWCFDSRAVEPTEALALETKALRAAFETDHEFGYQVLMRFVPVFAERIRTSRLQLTDMYSSK